MKREAAINRLRAALIDEALVFGEGWQPTGLELDWIIDCRTVLLQGHLLLDAAECLLDQLAPYEIDAVGGITLSADALTAGLLCCSALRGRDLNGFTIRKRRKEYGLRKLIEGPQLRPGNRVLIVDDLVSSGQTVQRAAELVRRSGATVVAVGTIVDFQRGARELLARDGVPLITLFRLTELGLTPPDTNYATVLRSRWRRPFTRQLPADGASAARRRSSCQPPLQVVDVNGALINLRSDSGEEHWRVPGVDAQSAICANRNMVIRTSAGGALHSFDVDTGRQCWHRRLAGEISSRPTISPDGHYLYLAISSLAGEAHVLAIETETGDVLWHLPARSRVRPAPAFDPLRAQVLACSDAGELIAVDSITGEVRWRARAERAIHATPVLDGDQAIALATDGTLFALNAASGSLTWTKALAPSAGTNPAAHRGVVLAGSREHAVAIDAGTGKVRWVACIEGATAGFVYHAHSETFLVGTASGGLYLIARDSGRLIARATAEGAIECIVGVADDYVCARVADRGLHTWGLNRHELATGAPVPEFIAHDGSV
jgi:orotate phosphoribosyltransferase